MTVLFFAVWGTDSILNYSTLIAGFIPLPLRLSLSILSLGTGGYLVVRFHMAIFEATDGRPELLNSGVYSWVRHPMYLGIWLFFLGFFLVIPSLLALTILAIFFIMYDRLATYEENYMIKVFGEKYLVYQGRVGKWFPRFRAGQHS